MIRLFAVFLLSLLPLTSGCALYHAPVIPPQGIAFAHVSAPIDTNAEATPTANMRSGEASTLTVLGLVSLGDASVQAAAREGGLRVVHHVDYEYKNVFFYFYQRFTIRAYGE